MWKTTRMSAIPLIGSLQSDLHWSMTLLYKEQHPNITERWIYLKAKCWVVTCNLRSIRRNHTQRFTSYKYFKIYNKMENNSTKLCIFLLIHLVNQLLYKMCNDQTSWVGEVVWYCSLCIRHKWLTSTTSWQMGIYAAPCPLHKDFEKQWFIRLQNQPWTKCGKYTSMFSSDKEHNGAPRNLIYCSNGVPWSFLLNSEPFRELPGQRNQELQQIFA